MQYLRGGDWVGASLAAGGEKVIHGLPEKGWIERRGAGSERAYRITEKGLVAKKAKIRIT